MASTDDEKYLQLYCGAREDYHFNLDGMHKHLNFYSALITAIFGAAIYKYFEVKGDPYHYLAVAFGPFGIIIFAWLGIRSTGRYYRASLEVVTKMAKLEQKLGLTLPDFSKATAPNDPWSEEALSARTQLRSRSDYANSFEFIDKNKYGGEFKIVRTFFYSLIFVAILFLWLIGIKISDLWSAAWMFVLPLIGGLISCLNYFAWQKASELKDIDNTRRVRSNE